MSDQLQLPLRIAEARSPRLSLARREQIFVNRDLDLSAVQWVGFDLDSTLVTYNEEPLADLIIGLLLERMARKGYASAVSKVRVDFGFVVRGLVLDTFLGHVLKLDQYHIVRRASHGTYALDLRSIETKYRARRVRIYKPRFRTVDGFYDRVVANVYVALIHALEARRSDIDYARLFEDLEDCGQQLYRDGSWTERVLDDLPLYVKLDSGVASVLSRFRSSGKRLFLLTNSDVHYVAKVLTYLLDAGGEGAPAWHHCFSVVVTSANKPAFFRPRKRGGDKAAPLSNRTESRTRMAEGGTLSDLEQWLGASSNRILYVGDHIFGDILKPRKTGSWQTALVLHELEEELASQEASSDVLRRLYHLQVQRWEFDDALRQNQKFLKELESQSALFASQGEAGRAQVVDRTRGTVKKTIESLRGKMRKLSGDEKAASETLEARFHPRWGPLLREGNELSSFGAQVQDNAGVYMARLSNFQRYSATQLFRAPRRLLPHER